MKVRRGRWEWEIPDGCRRVRPSRKAKARLRHVAAAMDEMGIEVWSDRGIWILAPNQDPVQVTTSDAAAWWYVGMCYGIKERGRLVRRLRAHHAKETKGRAGSALRASAAE